VCRPPEAVTSSMWPRGSRQVSSLALEQQARDSAVGQFPRLAPTRGGSQQPCIRGAYDVPLVLGVDRPQNHWADRLEGLLAAFPAIPLGDPGFPEDWKKDQAARPYFVRRRPNPVSPS
jgi:hypothetical protein